MCSSSQRAFVNSDGHAPQQTVHAKIKFMDVPLSLTICIRSRNDVFESVNQRTTFTHTYATGPTPTPFDRNERVLGASVRQSVHAKGCAWSVGILFINETVFLLRCSTMHVVLV